MVFDLDHALVGVDYSEVDHGVDPGGDVIAGYDVLGRDVHGHGPQIYLDHPVEQRKEDEEPWTLRSSLDPTEPKDHTPLVLLDDLDGAYYDRDDEYRDDHHYDCRKSYADGLQQTKGCVHEKSSFILAGRNPGHDRAIRWALPAQPLPLRNPSQSPCVPSLSSAHCLAHRLPLERTPAQPATAHRARTPTPQT